LALVLAFDPDADAAALAQGLAHFAGLPHRCEVVGHIAGVRYINDSKATNVSATAAAIAGLRDPQGALLVLLGGDGKGADFSVLGPVLADGVRAALLYGAAASELAAALAGQVPVYRCETLRAALAQARALARTGDTVLLSPACASFDQFANFEARGDAFRTAVAELAA
ncbi:MAG: cyanophycin synthetase, partial [Pseudomonadota bacterium]